jgi:hypothetical protein
MTPDSGDDRHIWRVTTVLLLPKYGPVPIEGGSPQQYELRSRLPEQARRYGDIAVAVRKRADAGPPFNSAADMQTDRVDLVADVPAGAEPHSAIERFTPVVETLIDLMAFEMGIVPRLGQVEITDITPPVAVGDERRSTSYSAPPFDRYMRSIDLLAIQGRLIGELPESVDIPDSKTAAVLRWFVKALDTDLHHDQFIFLWIALEILCDASDVRVEEPYVGPCQHQIPACPDCGRATTRMVRGATIKAFLQSYGVSADQAQQLWQMRQLMHGAIPFDSKKLENLGGLIQPLRAVVAAGLKSKLGKTPTDLPIVAAGGYSIHPAMGLDGSKPITEDDVRPLIPAEPQSNA